MGNIEFLLLAAEIEKNPAYREMAECIAVTALEKKMQNTDTLIWGGHVPGFMTGLSGIGYQLLRLYDPNSIPSLLSFQLSQHEVISR